MYTPDGGVEITKGLNVGELLVVQGFESLTEGAPVKISSRTTLQAAQTAAVASATPTPTASVAPPTSSARAQGSAHAPGSTP